VEQKWLQAQRDNTTDPLDSLLAEGFVNTESDGIVMNKAGVIADQKRVKFFNVDFDEMKMNASDSKTMPIRRK
jgi:hypothetical protein